MEALDWLIWGASFITGTMFVYGIMHYVGNRRMLRSRFRRVTGPAASGMPLYHASSGGGMVKRFMDWVSSFGKFAMKDKEETSQLRFSLIQGGFRRPNATAIFYGMQALGAVMLPLPYLCYNVMGGNMASGNLAIGLMLAGAGFYAPKYILKLMIRKRQDRMDKALPDVLDLLIVCMEAGLSLQATLNRVSDEVRPISVDLYQELHLTNAELRTGITREDALRNLGERTGVQNIKALMSMMIQSEKMGTSISSALRVHSDFLRVQRAQRAEAIAAKLPVKIMFPMLFFIFPAVFFIVLGPAVVNMMKSSFLSSVGKVGG